MRKFLDRCQSGDWEGACRDYLSEDFRCIEPPGLPQAGTFVGRNAPIEISKIYQEVWDVEVLSQQFWDDDDSDILISCYSIKWTAKTTGRTMTQPVVELNTVRNAQITEMRVFHFDAHGLLATLAPG